MSKISDAIVFGNPNYDKTIFTAEFREGCTDDELKELRNVLHGWSTAGWYSKEYRLKLSNNIREIDKLLEQRKKH